MNKTVFLVLKENIVGYPPVLSIMQTLLEQGLQVEVLGTYTDQVQKAKFEKKGVIFTNYSPYKGRGPLPQKLYHMVSYKRKVKKYLKRKYKEGDIVWIMLAQNVFLLDRIIGKYKTVLHFFEFVDPNINWKYRILNPFFDMGDACKKAFKVVCCEYNRAHITRGLFSLNNLPSILPNKYSVPDSELLNPPATVQEILKNIEEKIKGKKVILYQGIFLDKERRLEEFIQAVNGLGEEYILIAMGRGSQMYDDLKKRYSSNTIIFIDFIQPPYHLLVTKLATIGILTYFPRPNSIGTVLNPLYCAPNKIFEYSRFSIPMISNDVPALKYVYNEYHCGEIVTYPVTPTKIIKKIKNIFDNYSYYSKGAKSYYDSIDIPEIVNEILS